MGEGSPRSTLAREARRNAEYDEANSRPIPTCSDGSTVGAGRRYKADYGGAIYRDHDVCLYRDDGEGVPIVPTETVDDGVISLEPPTIYTDRSPANSRARPLGRRGDDERGGPAGEDHRDELL